jgi:hypothetical protein
MDPKMGPKMRPKNEIRIWDPKMGTFETINGVKKGDPAKLARNPTSRLVL